MFGLQGDLLDGDLDGALGLISDFGQDGGLKFQQPLQASLESLVIPDTVEDSFGEDWMETVDLSSLLAGNHEVSEVPDIVEVSQPAPLSDAEPQPRKEGLKASAFELLKQLLTCPVSETKVESVEADESLPSSPEVQVLDLQQFFNTPVADGSSLDLLAATEPVSSNCLEDLIEIKPEVTLDSMVVFEGQESVASPSDQAWSPPLSVVSLDSSVSMPSSPESLQTIDSSHLSELNDSFSQVSENDFVEVKSISKRSKRDTKSRTTPYNLDNVVHVADKKVRKKVQNKNAATRYRVKKRIEKLSLSEQEGSLVDRNKELKEKVESLQREISYMKELMSEIQKAKQKKY